jgi:HK97 family phage major capsid protein
MSVNVAEQYAGVQTQLQKVGSDLQNYHGETSSRLMALEQAVVGRLNDGGGFLGRSVDFSAQALQAFNETPAFGALQDWNVGTARCKLEVAIKAALTTGDSSSSSSDGNTYYPGSPERSGIALQVLRPLSLLDVLPSRPVGSDSVEFVQLRTDDEADYQVKEGDAKAEMDFSGNLAKANVVTVAGWTPASKQVLSDQTGLQQNIDSVMRHKVRSKLENQLINGVGGDGKIDGFLNQATPIVPAVAVNAVDGIGEALAVMRANGYQPNVVVLHPLDWFAFLIAKNNDDDYLFGSPVAPIGPGLWSVAVVQSASLARGQALIIDTQHVTLLDREQASVLLSNSHADFFIRNLIAILCELRAGLEIRDTGAVYHLEFTSSVPIP